MRLRIASPMLMCSTLILGQFGGGESDTLEGFKKKCREAVEEAQDGDTKDKIYSMWEPEKYEEIQVLQYEPVSSFAFIVASTEPYNSYEKYNQIETEKFLEKLGFKRGFGATTYNEKNETEINLWFIRVEDFLEAIQEKKEEPVCVASAA